MSQSPIADERKFPFFIVTTAATRRIRRGLREDDPGLSQVIATYTALAEIANEARAGNAAEGATEPFSAARKKLSDYSGCRSSSTVRGATEALERLGLLRIERRPIAGDRNLPNRYVLIGGVGSGDGPTQEADPGEGPADAGRVGSGDGGNRSRNTSSKKTPTPSEQVEEVHRHYVETFGRRGKAAELRDDEARIIRAALDAAEVDELKTAITACERSDYHMKRGEYATRKGGRYNSLGKILKPRPTHGETQRSRIDWWLEKASEQQQTREVSVDVNQRRREVRKAQGLD